MKCVLSLMYIVQGFRSGSKVIIWYIDKPTRNKPSPPGADTGGAAGLLPPPPGHLRGGGSLSKTL